MRSIPGFFFSLAPFQFMGLTDRVLIRTQPDLHKSQVFQNKKLSSSYLGLMTEEKKLFWC